MSASQSPKTLNRNNKVIMAKNATNELFTEVKEYLRLRKELFKTVTTLKATHLISKIAIVIISTILFTLFLTFIVVAITLCLKTYVGDIYAYILGAFIFIVIWYIIYLFRYQFIKTPIAKFLDKNI